MKTSKILSVILMIFISIKSSSSRNECPQGWEPYNHQKCITILRNATNAFGVDDSCTKVGGERWVYKSKEEDEFLWDFWKLNFPEQHHAFLWIGLTKEDDQNYRWRDGTLANDVADVNSACIKGPTMVCPMKIVRRDMKDSLICSFECDKADVYPVCERWLLPPSTTTPTMTEETTTEELETELETERPIIELPQSPLCEPGWDYFEDRCYHLTPVKYKGGAESRSACNMVGASVVSVASLEQQKFFETIIFYKDHGLGGSHYEGPAYLGARKNGNNSFIWDTGKQVDFTYWAPNEPSEGSCIIISRLNAFKGRWRTVSCGLSHRVLCGKPTIIGATTITPNTTESTGESSGQQQYNEVIEIDPDLGREEVNEGVISDVKSAETNAEEPKNPIQNASLVISIVIIILVAILFLICFVLRVRRKAKERNLEKLQATEKNGNSTTYEPTKKEEV